MFPLTIETSRGPVTFRQVGEPVIGIPQRYAVRDIEGGWLCSVHKSFDLANKRAIECNTLEHTVGRYKVEPYTTPR